MKLSRFRVTKFRNIIDSGWINVEPNVTCFVGKNEAGKSCLLEALYLFNPAYEGDPLNVKTQYPKQLWIADSQAEKPEQHAPIEVALRLSNTDIADLEATFGKGVVAPQIAIFRRKYNGDYSLEMKIDEAAAVSNFLRAAPTSIQSALIGITKIKVLRRRSKALENNVHSGSISDVDLTRFLASMNVFGDDGDQFDDVIFRYIEEKLPKFFLFTAYSTLPGKIKLQDLKESTTEGPGRNGIQTARCLFGGTGTKVDLFTDANFEARKEALEASQLSVSEKAFSYWNQNQHLEVNFELETKPVVEEGSELSVVDIVHIRIRDARTGYSNNIDQRSSGFQWFFSFFAAFNSFDGPNSPIVLLDEPGLTLHAQAQRDLLRFIDERLSTDSQVLYTTHSPFMIEPNKLVRVRIVEDCGVPTGSVVLSDIDSADPGSLFPLQSALGYDIAQNLLLGPNNLVVEGYSDLYYISAMSTICKQLQMSSLDPRWSVTPCGGSGKIPTFVALIGRHLNVTVLADSDTKPQKLRGLVREGYLSEDRLIFVDRVLDAKSADIEDLFDPEDFLRIYNQANDTNLDIEGLPPGNHITKRIEGTGAAPSHKRTAEYFLRNFEDFELSASSHSNFSKIFDIINLTLDEVTYTTD